MLFEPTRTRSRSNLSGKTTCRYAVPFCSAWANSVANVCRKSCARSSRPQPRGIVSRRSRPRDSRRRRMAAPPLEAGLQSRTNRSDAAARDDKRRSSAGKSAAAPNWYVNGQGQTFVVLRGPVEFAMGSPKERGRGGWRTKPSILACLNHSFAIAAKEITTEQFRRFKPGYVNDEMRFAPESNCPVLALPGMRRRPTATGSASRTALPKISGATCRRKPGEYKSGMRLRRIGRDESATVCPPRLSGSMRAGPGPPPAATTAEASVCCMSTPGTATTPRTSGIIGLRSSSQTISACFRHVGESDRMVSESQGRLEEGK